MSAPRSAPSARLLPAVLAGAMLFLTAGHAANAQEQEGVSLNYVNADVRDVIRSLSTILGINVLIAEDVPAKRVTYSTPASIRIEELGSVLEAILESEGLILVPKGPVAQVVPSERAPATGPVSFGKELPTPRPIGLVTQVVPLEHISADEGVAILQQLKSPLARIEPLPRANGLLVTDHAGNVASYLELLRQLDVQTEGEAGLRTYVVQLKHATASELAVTLAQVYGVEAGQAPPRPRVEALGGRSLSSELESFRQRELQGLEQRRQTPLPVLTAPSTAADAGGGVQEGTAVAGLVGRTTIVPELATNALVIRTEPPNFPVLQATIRELDVRPPQVLLEVFITEVTLDEATQYGINWALVTGNASNGGEYTGRLGAQRFTDSALTNVQDLVLRAVRLNDVDVRAVIRALATDTDVRVLSTPHIVALNNEQARILVGSQVPFSQSSRTGLDVVVDRVVQYRNVGTQLTIIPTINQDRYVTFRVLQEASALTTQTLEAALGAPIITTREAETSAIVRDGQTVVLGGLIEEGDEVVESGVPILKDIPLLGYLFKGRTTRRLRTELAIFVTPYIIMTDEDAERVRQREEGRLENAAPINRPPGGAPPP